MNQNGQWRSQSSKHHSSWHTMVLGSSTVLTSKNHSCFICTCFVCHFKLIHALLLFLSNYTFQILSSALIKSNQLVITCMLYCLQFSSPNKLAFHFCFSLTHIFRIWQNIDQFFSRMQCKKPLVQLLIESFPSKTT